MRLTTSELRRLAIDPAGFLEAQSQIDPTRGFGNVQRQWMDGAWRAYFASWRTEQALWAEFERRVTRGTPGLRRDGMAREATTMLEQFLEWEQDETGIPADVFPPIRDVAWESHTLAVRRDLTYITSLGFRLRQLWTDREMSIDHPNAGLLVAATLVCADMDLGDARTQSVEVWQLRRKRRRAWTREELSTDTERLRVLLNETAAELG
jgi:hypothetical protein